MKNRTRPMITIMGVGLLIMALPGVTVASATPTRPVSCNQPVAAGQAQCFAEVTTGPREVPLISSAPSGYGPTQLHAAYGVPAKATHPVTVAVVASSGDNGYGVEYPAASPAVVAAGGTTLQLSSKGIRVGETAWSQSGSGCSRFEAKPVWQHDKSCSARTVADISADADPATGAAIYDSLAYQAQQGWFVLGGTSLSAPLVAGMYGLAGGGSIRGLYQSSRSLHDVTAGRNGSCRTYLCQSGVGYDGPTGLGSPTGLAAFH